MPAAALIPLILSSLETSITLYHKIREIMQQNQEWTPEHEEAFQATLDKAKTAPHWQPRPKDV